VAIQRTKGLRIATRCRTIEQFVAAFNRYCDGRSVFISTMTTRPVGLETPFSIDLSGGEPALRGVGVVLAAWPTGANPFGRPGVHLGLRRLTSDSEPVLEQLRTARSLQEETTTPNADIAEGMLAARPDAVIPPLPPIPRANSPTIVPTGEPARASVIPPIKASGTVPPVTGTPPRAVPAVPPIAAVPSIVPAIAPMNARGTRDLVEPTRPEATRPDAKLPELTHTDIKVIEARRTPPLPAPALPPPPDEQRTPGSELVLPANPLMNLSDKSLEGFIDCSLYEETGNFFPEEEPLTDVDGHAELAGPSLRPTPIVIAGPGVSAMITAVTAEPIAPTPTAAPPPSTPRTNATTPPPIPTAALVAAQQAAVSARITPIPVEEMRASEVGIYPPTSIPSTRGSVGSTSISSTRTCCRSRIGAEASPNASSSWATRAT